MHVSHVSLENSSVDWMWLWWGGTVVLCLWKLIEAVVFRPARMLEWPFLACAMWLYFYGYMAYQAKQTLSAYLGNGISEIGQLMPFLCLVGLLAGWAVGMRMPIRPKSQTQNYPYLFCWLAGMFFIALGALGNYSVSKAGDEGDLNYHTASAYWYLLFYVGYPGLAIAVWAALKSKSPLKYALLGITLAGLVVFMLPQVLNARRGPLFPAIIVLLLVPPMTMRRPPSRLVYCGGLALTGLVMLVFLQARSVLYTGGSWSEAFQNIDVGNAVVDRGGEADDNEYVINCQVIGTTFQNGKYNYGTGHLGLFLHWVPRQVWPAKPVLGEGIYANSEMFDDVEKATGVRLLGSGAADAGVADSFIEYGVLCPFFWFLLAWLVGTVYLKAIRSGSPWWMFCYTGFLCSSHWLISQSFAASFVPGMYFQLVPLGVLAMAWLYRRWSVVPRKTGPRRAIPASAVPRALPS